MYLLVAALLSFMGISGFFGKSNLAKITVEAEFPSEVYANINFPLKITLKNKRRVLPVFLLRLKIGESPVFFPFVDTKGESTRYVEAAFEKRGAHEVRNVYISSVFPFNFFTRYRVLQDVFSFIVFPELKRCDLAELYEKGRKASGETATDKIGYESDMISIREYVHGDPIKYINWKATAKTGKLKTKELSSLSHQPVIIDFERTMIKDLEERISCIAYSIVQLLKKNMPIGLRMNGRFYEPGVSQAHKISMLKELALYKTANGES